MPKHTTLPQGPIGQTRNRKLLRFDEAIEIKTNPDGSQSYDEMALDEARDPLRLITAMHPQTGRLLIIGALDEKLCDNHKLRSYLHCFLNGRSNHLQARLEAHQKPDAFWIYYKLHW